MTNNNPVFILASSWRSGSTFLQRLITQTNEILIWGEAGGAINCFAEATERLNQMRGSGKKQYTYGYGGNGTTQYNNFKNTKKNAANQWIASMCPDDTTESKAFRDFFNRFYNTPAQHLGYPRWGLKEVQSGAATANFLKNIFPEAKFIYLIRNPFDCLQSIKKRNWIDKRQDKDPLSYFSTMWRNQTEELSTLTYGRLIRYEDLISKPETVIEIEKYLNIKTIDMNFLKKSRTDWPADNDNNLTWFEKRKIKQIVIKTANKYDYI